MSTLDLMRERLAVNQKALDRLEAGTCPDLPTDPGLLQQLIHMRRTAITECNRVITNTLRLNAETLDPEELV